jgi:hypothetical protein
MAVHFTSSSILLVFHVCLFLLWVSAHADDEASSSSSANQAAAGDQREEQEQREQSDSEKREDSADRGKQPLIEKEEEEEEEDVTEARLWNEGIQLFLDEVESKLLSLIDTSSSDDSLPSQQHLVEELKQTMPGHRDSLKFRLGEVT